MGPGGPPKKLDRATFARVKGLFKPYTKQVVAIVVLVLISALVGLANPFLLQQLVNEGLLARNLSVVSRNSLLSLVATIVATGTGIGYAYVSVVVGQSIMRDLRHNLFTHLQAMPLRWFTNVRTGEMQSRITNDVTSVQGAVSDTLANVLSNVTTALTTVVAMLILDWRLTALSVGVLPIFALIAAKVGKWADGARKKSQENLAALTSTTNEVLNVSGALLTKVSGRYDLITQRFDKENAEVAATQVKLQTIMRGFFSLFGLTFSITPVLVYWLAGYLIIGHNDPRLSLGTIVAFTSMQARLFFPITQLLNAQVELGSSVSLFGRIFEYLDLVPEIKDAPNAVKLEPDQIRGEVAFEGVGFQYDENQNSPTLKDIDLRAEGGQLVALVGSSGAGKTSLTYMIPRLYDVTAGRVTIDGHDVKDISLSSIGKIIGFVTQETYLVHDTIRENLRYGKPDATDAEIEDAARAAAIHDHIASLPDKYDTIVGERGYKLSGGEKQRISIARAILKDPPVLILDEATSALDTASERLVQSALERLMPGRTTFAIAHRLSTVRAADLILVMRHGEIVERGTHEELLALGGEYRRLYDLQFEE
jgi:ATP-binding cassette subfamily B protein